MGVRRPISITQSSNEFIPARAACLSRRDGQAQNTQEFIPTYRQATFSSSSAKLAAHRVAQALLSMVKPNRRTNTLKWFDNSI
jgi:hypothetical protein